jgi:hypothetical protein
MRFRAKYGSHLPVLLKVMSITSGAVLEMGAGYVSTSVLHWICEPGKRQLLTLENDPQFYGMVARQYSGEYHQVRLVEDWNNVDLDLHWSVALIDHAPSERRVIDILRLADCTDYIVVHDTNRNQDKHYHYRDIFPQFKYRYDYTAVKPYTTVLSNRVNLESFSV